jgi:post-segregation antitoxin (ccd killing protein)
MGKARAKVTLDADLLAEARSFGLDVSAMTQGALEAAVKAERARAGTPRTQRRSSSAHAGSRSTGWRLPNMRSGGPDRLPFSGF